MIGKNVPQIGNLQNCGLKKFVRFADLLQMGPNLFCDLRILNLRKYTHFNFTNAAYNALIQSTYENCFKRRLLHYFETKLCIIL
jgi:hypothetical protein